MENETISLQDDAEEGGRSAIPPAFEQLFERIAGRLLRLRRDRRQIAALLGRYSAHLGLVALALLLFFVSQITITPVSVANEADSFSAAATEEALPTPTETGGVRLSAYHGATQMVISRQAMPHTTIPDRVRLSVITYTVQPGDTVFGIAEKFGLSPYTIVWSNMETLQGAPWLLQPGLTLDIPPVDGAYHTVQEGETVESIAADYDVEPEALYNMWNDIRPGQPLREGQRLVIPGGVGDDFDWEPPPPRVTVASASYSSGFCGNVNVSGPGANGWFILPTGSTSVSGWYFHDPRNPRHIGLDYRCYLDDPIYAADNGVVIFAGWGGGYGNLVKIDHGNGYITYYAHLDAIYVQCGQSIYQGQVVGLCGTTGWSTGPHLHYEIRFNGVPQDPRLYEP